MRYCHNELRTYNILQGRDHEGGGCRHCGNECDAHEREHSLVQKVQSVQPQL